MQNKVQISYTDHQLHSCRADKNPYRHDGRADKDTYRHDGRAYSLNLIGQRYINITRNAIGPKSGKKDCRKF